MSKLTAKTTLMFCGIVVAVCGFARCSQADIVYTDLSSAPLVIAAAPGNYTYINSFNWNFGEEFVSFINYNHDGFTASYISSVPSALGSDGAVAVLTNGTSIDGTLTYGNPAPDGMLGNTGYGDYPADWAGQSGYLGLYSGDGNGDEYGWVRMSVADFGGNYAITITGYAYNDTPDAPIIAGAESGGGPAVPEPSSVMLMFSAAAAGLPLYRRFRKKTPAA